MKTIIKEKLEESEKYAFDKQVLEREMEKGRPRIEDFYKRYEQAIEDLDLPFIRKDMNKKGEDITSKDIKTINKLIPIDGRKIPIQIYRPLDTEGDKKRKAMIFFHGGGFIGGDLETKKNQCKYLAQQADMVVISPEYRLAPETPFPGQVEDAKGTLEWIALHADELKIDSNKIAVAGDSAGGTLVGNVCLLDKKRIIKEAFYIYGAVDLTPAEDTPYQWDYSCYKMYEKQKDYIMGRLHKFKELTEIMKG